MTPAVYGIMFFALGAAIMFASWVTARHLSASRQAKAAIATNKDFHGLADEYRRLSDMAITAQEHTDLQLVDPHADVGEPQVGVLLGGYRHVAEAADRPAAGPDGAVAAHPQGSRVGLSGKGPAVQMRSRPSAACALGRVRACSGSWSAAY